MTRIRNIAAVATVLTAPIGITLEKRPEPDPPAGSLRSPAGGSNPTSPPTPCDNYPDTGGCFPHACRKDTMKGGAARRRLASCGALSNNHA
jgi:hypothetical protein